MGYVLGVIVAMIAAAAIATIYKKKWMYCFVPIAFVVVTIACGIRVIPPGHIGVPVLFGKVDVNERHAGLHVINPLKSIKLMSIRTQEYTMTAVKGEGAKTEYDAIKVLTKDGLPVDMDMTALFRLIPDKADEVFSTIGLNYIDVIVRPKTRTQIREDVTRYTFEELYDVEQRTAAALQILKNLNSALEPRGIFVEEILIRDIRPPKKISDAIALKLEEQQNVQRMQFTLEKEAKEALRKEVEAGGVAIAQEIINKSITPQYLQYYYIMQLEKIAKTQNTTVVIMPFDQNLIPMLNITGPTGFNPKTIESQKVPKK